MSNLSTLLPAGASGKTFDAIASGAIASKKPVILNSAGTVTEVTGGTSTTTTTTSADIGDAVQFETGNVAYVSSVYDTNAKKVVAFYLDYGNSQYGTACVGTSTGGTTNSISWGTPVVFNSGGTTENNAVFDSNANKIINVYKDGGASNYGNAIVGTVSGTSISFGSEATWNAGSTTNIGAAFDSTANKVVIAYRDDSNGDRSTAVVGTVSGTSISFGSEVVFRDHPSPGRSNKHKVVYDSNANKSVICFALESGGYGTCTVVTLSGTTPSFGTEVTFKAANLGSIAPAFDSNSNKVVIVYSHSSNKGTAVVGTISGTSISFGTEAEFNDGGTTVKSATFDSGSNKIMVGYVEAVTTHDGWLAIGTVSGTGISFATTINITDPHNSDPSGIAYDSNADKTVVCYSKVSDDGRAQVVSPTSALTPASNYYVQSDGSISTTATSPAVKIGRALSGTTIDLEYQS